MIPNTCHLKPGLYALIICSIYLFSPLEKAWPQEGLPPSYEAETGLQVLETRRIELEDCRIHFDFDDHPLVIKNKTDIDSLIRKGGIRAARCAEQLSRLDFDKHTLLGIELNSGWCRVPRGLAVETLDDEAEQRYIFVVSYEKPVELCRALTIYDVWVLVPRLPTEYEVVFQIKEIPPEA